MAVDPNDPTTPQAPGPVSARQDPRTIIEGLFSTLPPTSGSIDTILAELSRRGIPATRAGSGAITLPDGSRVTLLTVGSNGQAGWSYNAPSGTIGDLTAPFPEPWNQGGPGTPDVLWHPPAFTAPTAEDVYADPSYQFRLSEGTKALEQSAAGRGMLNTGGTIKDVLGYGQNFASQEYGNVWNRKMQQYQNAAYNPWQTQATGAQRAGEFDWNAAFQGWQARYNAYRNWQQDAYNKQLGVTSGG